MAHQRKDQIVETIDKERPRLEDSGFRIQEIIDKNIEYLVDKIELKTNVFWDKLIKLGLYTSSDVNYIKVSFPFNQVQQAKPDSDTCI